MSPPHEGSVHEGFEGDPEIDFQQSQEIPIHWKGFFDRESGVWFYLYTVSNECSTQQILDIHNMTSEVEWRFITNKS